MTAFLIADIRVINEQKFAGYRRALRPAIAAQGGRQLARGQAPHILEGGWTPQRMVVIEFPDWDALARFRASPAYHAARDLGHNCAMIDAIAVPGLKPARHAFGAAVPAYAVADTHLVNRARFTDLMTPFYEATHKFHGRHLAWSDRVETVEGNWAPSLITLIEFPLYDSALAAYASDEYRQTHELFRNAAMIDLVLLRGASAADQAPAAGD